jgi:hypothetical protein
MQWGKDIDEERKDSSTAICKGSDEVIVKRRKIHWEKDLKILIIKLKEQYQ